MKAAPLFESGNGAKSVEIDSNLYTDIRIWWIILEPGPIRTDPDRSGETSFGIKIIRIKVKNTQDAMDLTTMHK